MDSLFANTGATPTQAERERLSLLSAAVIRWTARALRSVIESGSVYTTLYNHRLCSCSTWLPEKKRE